MACTRFYLGVRVTASHRLVPRPHSQMSLTSSKGRTSGSGLSRVPAASAAAGAAGVRAARRRRRPVPSWDRDVSATFVPSCPAPLASAYELDDKGRREVARTFDNAQARLLAIRKAAPLVTEHDLAELWDVTARQREKMWSDYTERMNAFSPDSPSTPDPPV